MLDALERVMREENDESGQSSTEGLGLRTSGMQPQTERTEPGSIVAFINALEAGADPAMLNLYVVAYLTRDGQGSCSQLIEPLTHYQTSTYHLTHDI
jgi:hypothetical protein